MPKKPIIKYSNRDFDEIKSALVEHAKRYYPDKYNDFNDSSFGSMLFDSVAYVGDIMSFYLDFQFNESFLETALQKENVRRIAAQMGYKYYGRPSSYGMATFYIKVPSKEIGTGPDDSYTPVLKKGSQIKSSSGANFILLEDVDFNRADVEVVAADYDSATQNTTQWAMRGFGRVKSGARFLKSIDIGSQQSYLKVLIGTSIINEIESCYDSQGNRWYQVDHLTQDTVYLEQPNPNYSTDGTPAVIKPHVAARRFQVYQDDTGTYLQFGNGSEEDLTVKDVTDPSQVVLQKQGRNYITDGAFDPNELLLTNKFGIAPANTTLRIIYGANTQQNVSVGLGQLNQTFETIMEFPNSSNPVGATYDAVKNSLEPSNDEIISNNTIEPTADEMKYRAYACHASQNRAVTKNDYEALCYKMPPNLGSIKRVSVYNDPSGTNRRLALYVLSEDTNGYFVQTNSTIKKNIKVWLQKNKMLNDGIDILDAKIINFSISYEAVIDPTLNSLSVLADVDSRLRELFSVKRYIGENIYLNEMYTTINKTIGVVDTVIVNVKIEDGADYSSLSIDIDNLLSKDGSYIKTPKNCALEMKYLDRDIKGTAT
ncbi:hypothetical protein N8467_00370 [bacterium]|nr:hypothetical protein [bacterium]